MSRKGRKAYDQGVFFAGSWLSSAASAVNRLIGLVYMVALPRLIFDEGMGLYQLVKPIHYFAAVVAIGGMPVGIAKLIAEKAALGSAQEVKRVFRTGLLLLLISGGVVALALSLGAPWFAKVLAKDAGITPHPQSPGTGLLFFLALSAGFRGFFQGLQYMTPTAISQVADQVVRVAATIGLSLYFRPRGLELAVMGVAAAFILGELTGWLILAGAYLLQGPQLLRELKEKRPQPEPRRQLADASSPWPSPPLWPPSSGQSCSSRTASSSPCACRRQASIPRQCGKVWGHLGMALTLAQFPNIVTVALATSLVPAISEAWALARDRVVKHRAEEALRMALIFGIPSCAALYVLAEPLCQILFSYGQVGEPLRILAAGTVTLGVIQATTGVLQGLGAMAVPVRNLCAGVLLKFALNFLLVANPSLGVLGAAWSTTLSWALVAALNLFSVFRRGGRGGQLAPGRSAAWFSRGRGLGPAVSAPGYPGPFSAGSPCGLRSSGLLLHPVFPAAHDLGAA